MLIAHVGQPVRPHDLWGAWHLDPFVVVGLITLVWVYRRGRRRGEGRLAGDRRRDHAFAAAVLIIGVALVSPLDAAAGALASAHMAQHMLLILGAAPLLAASGLGPVLYRAGPRRLRDVTRPWRHRIRGPVLAVIAHPGAVVLAHIAAIWVWHARLPYDAAARSQVLHAVEHLSFLLTAFLFWRIIAGRWPADGRGGLRVMALFVMSLQGVFLAALLTFAQSPWYSAYTESAPAFGLSPLADQQLAGLIMWIPSGLVYLGFALASVVRSLGTDIEPGRVSLDPRSPS